MHVELVKLGYDGSYERVAAFARAWREDRHRAEQTTGRGTYVPLVFQPDEAFKFDWSEDCRNTPLSILPCTIISTRNATSIHDKTSSLTVPSLSPSGVNSVPGKFTLFAGN